MELFGPGDEKWAQLFASPESEQLLSELAREAHEEYLAGRTTDIVETDDGFLAPSFRSDTNARDDTC